MAAHTPGRYDHDFELGAYGVCRRCGGERHDVAGSPIPCRAVKAGRDEIARLAEESGEFVFARQVRAGAWDDRRDVVADLAKAEGPRQWLI